MPRTLSIHLVSLLFFIFLGKTSYTQILTVRDADTFEPLELVSFHSNNPKASGITSSNGKLDIQDFKGADVIELRLMGYKTIRMSYEELIASPDSILLHASQLSLDQVVISSVRWEQNMRDVPEKITSISPRQRNMIAPQTAADLLGISNEVFIQKSQQAGGSPMIRGFAANRLLYAVDGVRMNNAIYRSGNIQNVISLDPFSIESTEIVYGAGSVSYGSDAIGAVMAFQTLSPQFSPTDKINVGGHANIRYSSANQERTGHLDINLGWKKWASVTSISSYEFEDAKMGRFGPEDYLRNAYVKRIDNQDYVMSNTDPLLQIPSAYDQTNIMQKLRYQPNSNWDILYAFHYSGTGRFDRYDRMIQLEADEPRYGEWYYGPQTWMMNQLDISYHEPKKIFDSFKFRTAWQKFGESRHSRRFNNNLKSNTTEKLDAYSVNLDFQKSFRNYRLFYGFEYILNDLISEGTEEQILTSETNPGPARYPDARWSSWAAYANFHQTISPKVNLQAGIRFNQILLKANYRNNLEFYPLSFEESENLNKSLSGSLGMVFRPEESWMLTANVATAFRAPNVDDIGKIFDSEPGAVVVPNPDLKPEYAYNAEINTAKVFGEWAKLEASLYYTYLNQAMVRRNSTFNGQDSIVYEGVLSQVQSIQNASSVIVYGYQLSLEFKLPKGFGIQSHYNFQFGTERTDGEEDSPARHAAPVFGSSSISFESDGLRILVYALYNLGKTYAMMPVTERNKPYLYASDENGNPYSPSWYTLNAKISYAVAENLLVHAGLENMTNQRYRPYSSGIAGLGTNYTMSLQFRF